MTDPVALSAAVDDCARPLSFVGDPGRPQLATEGQTGDEQADALPVCAQLPALRPGQLGDASFARDHGLRCNLMTGAMAGGIASPELVIAAARAGLLGSYGAAGRSIDAVSAAIDQIGAALPDGASFCANLIHSPNEPEHEAKVVDCYLAKGLRLVEASAYLALTPAVVRYRVTGLHRDATGRVVAPNRIIAKASRVEVATRWFSPPPAKLLDELLATGQITAEERSLAAEIPMAQDLTAEADSGGHTDNRPALCLLPSFLALRDRLQAEHGYDETLRVGLGGGIATPQSAAAAFAMGAAYVVTGTVNQACIESGTSDLARRMLAGTEQADVIMAPAADMFEMGVELQVLKRGTMFAMRAKKLYEWYRQYDSIQALPPAVVKQLEEQYFRAPLAEIWAGTEAFWREREPRQLEKAQQKPKHALALLMRWYLGMSSKWASAGQADRQVDFQIWCGPAMGAFNEWAKGSPLETAEARSIAAVNGNILLGAARQLRREQLRQQGLQLALPALRPVAAEELGALLA